MANIYSFEMLYVLNFINNIPLQNTAPSWCRHCLSRDVFTSGSCTKKSLMRSEKLIKTIGHIEADRPNTADECVCGGELRCSAVVSIYTHVWAPLQHNTRADCRAEARAPV